MQQSKLSVVDEMIGERLVKLNTYVDPKAVPRMVWGLKNLQKESLNSEILSDNGLDAAASTLEQAWQISKTNEKRNFSLDYRKQMWQEVALHWFA